MMMDLDLDLADFDSDRIQEFLKNKLEQVRLSNLNLEQVIKNRKEQAANLGEDSGTNPPIILGKIWKKINNNKYIFGVNISNTGDTTLRSPLVIAQLAPDTPIRYKSLLVEHEDDALKRVDSLKGSGYLAIVMDVPSFVDHLEYTFSGSVAFLVEGGDRKVRVDLPPVKLSSEDFTDNVVLVKTFKAVEGSLEDLLVFAVSDQKYEFVVLLPAHWDRSLDNALETYCSLRRVELNRASMNTFFLVHNISAIIDGSLVEIAGDKLNFYTKNDESARMLLHHLHRHLINVAVIPAAFYKNYLFEKCPDEADTLRRLLLKEHEFSRDNNPARDSFRMDLAQLEYDSDLFVLRVNEISKYKGEMNSQYYN